MRALRDIALLLIASLSISILLLQYDGTAQQRSQRPPASDFDIELLNLDAPSHVYSVPGPGARDGYIAHSNLRRLAGWKPSDEVPAEVAALRVKFWSEEGAVRVEVMAHFGKSHPSFGPSEWANLVTEKVASRLVHAGETVSIDETERFGIEPFKVKIFRAKPWSIGPPEILNKTQALSVTATREDRPVYILTVHNVSHKHIEAIRWYGLEDGRRGGGSGLSGARLIAAGSVFEIRQRFAAVDEAQAEGSKREQPSKREIVIDAILFEDGTFEGEADAAAEMAANTAGERRQILRAILLLRAISLAPDEDPSWALSKLKAEIASLSEDVDPGVVNKLALRFGAASEVTRNRRIKEEVRNGLRFVKTMLLAEIERFEYSREQSPERADFQVWLKEIIKTFERTIGSH